MACEDVELLLVGAVVGDWRVLLVVDELAVVEDPEVVDEPEVVEVVLDAAPLALRVVLVVLAGEAVAVPPEVPVVDLAWWGWAASAANSPTPASEPAATQPVAWRLRRNQRSRSEGVVMPPSKDRAPQSRLSVASTPRYKWLGAS